MPRSSQALLPARHVKNVSDIVAGQHIPVASRSKFLLFIYLYYYYYYFMLLKLRALLWPSAYVMPLCAIAEPGSVYKGVLRR